MVDYYRTDARFVMTGGENCSFGYNHRSVNSVIPADVNILLNAATEAFWNAIKDRYTDGIYYVGNSVRRINAAGSTLEVWENAPAAPIGGSDTGDAMLPHEVAVVVSTIAGAARSQKGRFYLPPPNVNECTQNARLTIAARDDFAAAAKELLAPDSGGFLRGVVHSKTNGTFADMTSIKVGDVFDAQRRRRDRLVEAYKIRDF